jgi:membrane-bound serine protease (ClpP class)
VNAQYRTDSAPHARCYDPLMGAARPGLKRSFAALLTAIAGFWLLGLDAETVGGSAALVPIDGPIGPATSSFVKRSLAEASEQGDAFVVLTIDTPGGLDTAMREIVQAILASNVPVIGYVSPGGARAASAGTFILYASHVAAMAPATNLGAATPVQIGGSGAAPAPGDGDAGESGADGDKGSSDKSKPGSALERKAVNDAVAYIRSLAELRNRNADWGESAVRDGASLSSSQALELGVIDLVADDLPGLLKEIDGREVKLQSRSVQMQTEGTVLRTVEPDWRTDLLSLLTNPNVAYLLMLIGIYGLLLEGYNPGAIVPGVVGAICLLLALFAFQVLSVNYAGLALIALGVVLIVAETFVPSFGALGLGGIIAFVIGSVMLLDDEVPGFGIAWQVIGMMAFAGALVLLAIVSFAVRARRRPIVSGAEGLLNERAEALQSFEGRGSVRVHGETWDAMSRAPVRQGQRLRIVRVDGLTLEVEPIKD